MTDTADITDTGAIEAKASSVAYSTIVSGWLYSGPYTSWLNEWPGLHAAGVKSVISIVPIASPGIFKADPRSVIPRPLIHKVLFAWDDTVLAPDQIDVVISHPNTLSSQGPVFSTFIHCNSGENRSTALAACWLLRHTSVGGLRHEAAEQAISRVYDARTETLGRPPKLHDVMRANVAAYASWLQSRL